MRRLFMVDIETTGTILTPNPMAPEEKPSKILQVAFLELIWNETAHLWKPEAVCEWLAYHEMPKRLNPFQAKYQKGLFERCEKSRMVQEPAGVRSKFLSFFTDCGAEGCLDRILCGWNASNFDVPFLHRDKLLVPPYTDNETDELVGDHHYRIYEMGGAIQFLENKHFFEVERKDLTKGAEVAGWQLMLGAFGTDPDEIKKGRGEHDALFDCYNQTAILNGMLHD